ncbi:unnamed protein product [Pylaiella littoralis]
MRGALDLMEMVLDGASRLGQAVNPERLERPRGVVGLAASCILLALRHLGPLSATPRAAAAAGAGGGGGGDGAPDGDNNAESCSAGGRGRIEPDPAPLDDARSAGVAAGAFVEVLGRALDARFSKHLGSAALTTVMSAVLHCWPQPRPPPGPGPPPARADDSSGSAVAAAAAAAVEGTPEAEAAGVAEDVGRRGYAMGWWRLDLDGRLTSSNSSSGGGDNNSGSCRVGGSALNRINADAGVRAGGGGGVTQPAEQQVLEDEYGSLSFFDDPELDAILSGSVPSQSSTQQQVAAVETEAAEAAEAAKVAAIDKEQEEIWSSLADGARKHVLPHLYEILRKTYTVARYAPGSSTPALPSSASFDHHHHHRNPAASSATASLSSAAVARGAPPRASTMATSAGNRGGGNGSSSSSSLATTGRSSSSPSSLSSSSSTAAVLSSVDFSRVDVGTLLELHSTAALVALRGSSSGSRNSSSSSGSGSQYSRDFGANGRSGSGGGGGDSGPGYNAVRDKYLDVHRMAHNPLVPQQRLLAPAFFCLALGGGGGHDDDDYRQRHSGAYSSPGGSRYPTSQRPAPPVLEALRGREWEIVQLWMQAALDPLVFPVSQRRRNLSRGSGGGGSGRRSSREPSDIVRERFEGFTRCLSAAFGTDGGSGGGSSREGQRQQQQQQQLPLDADVAGMFEKRLVRVEPAQLAALSPEETAVLERVLDMQSVVAHCSALWSTALVISGPERLPEGDRKRIKDRVLKLVHGSIKSVRRFLPEVFPRQEQQHQRATRSSPGASTAASRKRSGDRSGTGLPPPRYGSAFRRLYGDAAYSLAAFLTRMCGGGVLKGLPLRELVETFFEGVACRGSAAVGSSSGGRCGGGGGGGGAGGAAAGGSAPHAELTALAVKHLPDLLQCFSETIMTMTPVAEWMKNINDHAIHGEAPAGPAPPSSSSSSSSSSPSLAAVSLSLPPPPPGTTTALTPILASLACGLRGDLAYVSSHRRRPVLAGESRTDDTPFGGLIAAASLAPPPCRDPAVRPKRREILRREVLGDRKLRVARFLMEAATSRGSMRQQLQQQTAISLHKTGRLLALLTGVFGHRGPDSGDGGSSGGGGGGGGGSLTGLSSRSPPLLSSRGQSRPPLSTKKDILPLVRPVYSLLGEALLGDAGLPRRLAPEALAVAAALVVAGLDQTFSARAAAAATAAAQAPEGAAVTAAAVTVAVAVAQRGAVLEQRQPGPRETGTTTGEDGDGGESTTERRVVDCLAEVVVLALSTTLDTVLASVPPAQAGGGGSGNCNGDGSRLADLGPRETELERLLVRLGAWESQGCEGRGWPHSAEPSSRAAEAAATAATVSGVGSGEERVGGGGEGGGGGHNATDIVEDSSIPLPQLLEEARKMVAAIRLVLGGERTTASGVIARLLEEELVPRLSACRAYLGRPSASGGRA